MRGRWLRGAPPQSPPSTPAPRAQTEGGLLDPLTEGQALRSSRASKQAVSTSPECSLSAFTGLGAWDRPLPVHVAQGGSQRTGGTQQAPGLCYSHSKSQLSSACSARSPGREEASRQDVTQ